MRYEITTVPLNHVSRPYDSYGLLAVRVHSFEHTVAMVPSGFILLCIGFSIAIFAAIFAHCGGCSDRDTSLRTVMVPLVLYVSSFLMAIVGAIVYRDCPCN